jgi:hypothetical protein
MTLSSDYIVRVYRFEKDNPRSIVGLVEEVGKKGKKAFNTYDELWEILNSLIEQVPVKSLPPGRPKRQPSLSGAVSHEGRG